MRPLFVYVAAASALLGSACTMNKQEAPPLAGPSEFGTSITIAVTPDVLTQDGASQSSIVVTARDANGQPVRGLALRVETAVNGERMDFGNLSARTIVTGNDGRATTVYTAPAAPDTATDPFTIVEFVVTPIGTDFGNSTPRTASLRLTPPGWIIPVDGMQPKITITSTLMVDNEPILFDATQSTSSPNNPIALCTWNFGDGTSASGYQVSHEYRDPGTYTVRLTLTDGYGRSASTSQTITVSAGAVPTAAFTFSPAEPIPGQTLNFNAVSSTAAAGRDIVRYDWDFGDGASGTGVQTTHVFAAGKYVVTLKVTDDAGRKGTVSKEIDVKTP
jgi:hypothetical protein